MIIDGSPPYKQVRVQAAATVIPSDVLLSRRHLIVKNKSGMIETEETGTNPDYYNNNDGTLLSNSSHSQVLKQKKRKHRSVLQRKIPGEYAENAGHQSPVKVGTFELPKIGNILTMQQTPSHSMMKQTSQRTPIAASPVQIRDQNLYYSKPDKEAMQSFIEQQINRESINYRSFLKNSQVTEKNKAMLKACGGSTTAFGLPKHLISLTKIYQDGDSSILPNSVSTKVITNANEAKNGSNNFRSQSEATTAEKKGPVHQLLKEEYFDTQQKLEEMQEQLLRKINLKATKRRKELTGSQIQQWPFAGPLQEESAIGDEAKKNVLRIEKSELAQALIDKAYDSMQMKLDSINGKIERLNYVEQFRKHVQSKRASTVSKRISSLSKHKESDAKVESDYGEKQSQVKGVRLSTFNNRDKNPPRLPILIKPCEGGGIFLTAAEYGNEMDNFKRQLTNKKQQENLGGTQKSSFFLVSAQSQSEVDFNDERGNFEGDDGNQFRDTFGSNMILMHRSPVKKEESGLKITREEVRQVIDRLVDAEMKASLQQQPVAAAATAKGHTNQTVFQKVAAQVKQELESIDLLRNAFTPKLCEELKDDIRLKFFTKCHQQGVITLPLLHKIYHKILNLTGYTLNGTLLRAFVSAISKGEESFNKVLMENNSIHDDDFRVFLEGLANLAELKSIVTIRNEFNVKSVEALQPLLLKNIPHHLEELRLVNCPKISSAACERLLKILNQKCYIRKLSLVDAGINDDICLRELSKLMNTSRFLTELDISWNRMRPQGMLEFLDALSDNRTLRSLNLSWNNLMEQTEWKFKTPSLEETELPSEEEVKEMMERVLAKKEQEQKLEPEDLKVYFLAKLSRFIKLSRSLQHLDLSHTGLSELQVRTLSIALRRARSIVSIHFCGNPGVTMRIKEFLFERLKCRKLPPQVIVAPPSINTDSDPDSLPQESFDRSVFAALDKLLSAKEIVCQSFKINEQETKKRIMDKPISSLNSDSKEVIQREGRKLIFQRHLGHRVEIPYSTKWHMLTEHHEKCWVCDRHVYSMLLWTKNVAFKRGERVFEGSTLDSLVKEIDQINSQNPHLKNATEVPLICGTFTSWQYVPLWDLHIMINQLDPKYVKPTKENVPPRTKISFALKRLKIIKDAVFDQLVRQYEEERKRRWRQLLFHVLKYRRTFLPHLEDCPHSYESIQDYDREESSESSGDDQSYMHSDEEELQSSSPSPFSKKSPKYCKDRNDQIFVLPTFLRAGRHAYVVRTVNKENEGKVQHYFHREVAPARVEDILPIVKPSKMQANDKKFRKDLSVFKDWKEDTPQTLEKCALADQPLWKAPRFIKDQDDLKNCWDLIVRHMPKLMEVFISLASRSTFPHISLLDFSNHFCEPCDIIDQKAINHSAVDRLFISANYEVVQNRDNPDKALCRYEFYEVLLRIANAKFRETGHTHSYYHALERLLKEHVLYKFKCEPLMSFREELLWTQECNDVYEVNFQPLFKVFTHFYEATPSAVKKHMSMKDAIELVTHLTPVCLPVQQAILCYGLSKMTVIEDATESTVRYKRLQYVEFLDYLGRVADAKFKKSDLDVLPLHKKIEFVIDDVLTLVGEKRVDVKSSQADEESASDDEY